MGNRQDLFFFLDDSGVLDNRAPSNYFCYAGYLIVGKDAKNGCIRKFRSIASELKQQYSVPEIKGSSFNKDYGKQIQDELRLYKCMIKADSCYSLILEVDVRNLLRVDFSNKYSVMRYKNYAVKMLIKKAIERIIENGTIEPDGITNIKVLIDEEHQATNGIYNLKETITSELYDGISNWDYGSYHAPILSNKAQSIINVAYCDSCKAIPVQTADILANLYHNALDQDDKKAQYRYRTKNNVYLPLP